MNKISVVKFENGLKYRLSVVAIKQDEDDIRVVVKGLSYVQLLNDEDVFLLIRDYVRKDYKSVEKAKADLYDLEKTLQMRMMPSIVNNMYLHTGTELERHPHLTELELTDQEIKYVNYLDWHK